MPSLIGNYVAANYRKSGPSTRLGTRELVSALITINNTDLSDYSSSNNENLFEGMTNPGQQAGTSDGNFAKAISAIQTIGEIYAIGDPVSNGGNAEFTVILSADTLSDSDFTDSSNNNSMGDNDNATTLGTVLNTLFGQSVTVNYTRMQGLSYD